jgi:hypothetical protein
MKEHYKLFAEKNIPAAAPIARREVGGEVNSTI